MLTVKIWGKIRSVQIHLQFCLIKVYFFKVSLISNIFYEGGDLRKRIFSWKQYFNYDTLLLTRWTERINNVKFWTRNAERCQKKIERRTFERYFFSLNGNKPELSQWSKLSSHADAWQEPRKSSGPWRLCRQRRSAPPCSSWYNFEIILVLL